MARASIKRIKVHRTYEIPEAAEVVGVTPQTIRAWGNDGLLILKARHPHLVRGVDLKAHILRKRERGKRPLELGQVYCFSCHDARTPAFGMLDYAPMSQSHGKLSGFCSVCDGCASRIVRRVDLDLWGQVCRIGGTTANPA